MAKFFIDRPIFAWVISLVIIFAGGAALFTLPIAQYPEITPPTVQVTANYPGASAQVVRDTVAAPIEQQVNGVENMLYMSSQSTNDGGYNLTVTFELGTNLNMAQVLVQNRVSQAMATLPDVVKATGVTTLKKSPAILLVVNLFSDINPDTKEAYWDQLFLSNYGLIQIKDELTRLKGVGDVSFLGQQDYSMRMWLDPNKLSTRNITVMDVVNSVKEQNVQVAAGRLAGQPTPPGPEFQYNLTTKGRLLLAKEFADIVVNTGQSTQVTYLKDIARIDLGAKNMDTRCRLDGQPSVGLAVFQLPGSNALDTAENIKTKMRELAKVFPKGLRYSIVYDTTPFIEESVHEVFKALRDAIILVAIVVLFFLQDWKAMILPMIDVPVSLIGTLAIMSLLGFTLNNLTLFGLVLAIGIVVDDAIVVLENIEKWIAKGLPPKEATIKAMGEVTGPIIAITLVLSSVFLPSAFISGITGQFFQQFALTISASMMISAINAMTLTPSRAVGIFKEQKAGEAHHEREALPRWGVAALLGYLTLRLGETYLGPVLGFPVAHHGGEEEVVKAATPMFVWVWRAVFFLPGAVAGWMVAKTVNRSLAVVFKGFNKVFDKFTAGYSRTVRLVCRLSVIMLIVYAGLLFLTYRGFVTTPTGFIPAQDKGYLVVNIQLPDSASLDRTDQVVKEIEAIAKEIPGVKHQISIPGQSFVLNAISSNFGSMFVILDSFEKRGGSHDLYSDVIADKLRKACYEKIKGAQVGVFGPPAVDGLGNAGGFKLMVEDRADLGLQTLQGQADNLAELGNQVDGLVGLFNTFRASTPQYYVDVDRTKCKTMGVNLNDVFNTLQVYLGGMYVNDFNRFGRTWQVNVQADAPYRLKPADISLLMVRNRDSQMVPLGSLCTVQPNIGPVLVTRYNTYTSAAINGGNRPDFSSGQVIQAMDELAERELPVGMKTEWTELTFLQIQAGNTIVFAFGGAVILVFLVLAAMYESWTMPMAILLVVPMCLLSSIIGVVMAKLDINIFVQVGLVVLVGLACKNAILIVEFARELRGRGLGRLEAAVEASKERFRPIIMTSFAFLGGVAPLILAHGAGAEMRYTLGVAVFAGMLGVTIFGVLLTPLFYYLFSFLQGDPTPAQGSPEPGPGGPPPTKDTRVKP